MMRAAIGKWIPPHNDDLEGSVYARGKPYFYPFPTVTEVVAAAFCPRAALHLLLHGKRPFISIRKLISGVGEDYHRVIAKLKLDIASGALSSTNPAVIRNMVYETAYNPKNVWPFIQKWVQNHLAGVRKGDDIYFETTLASDPRFNIGRLEPFYIRGKIDEVDLTNKRLVERTTRKKDDALAVRKDLQIWLLQQVLCSVSQKDLPKEWRGQDFSKFDLVLETPDVSFNVAPDPQFENETLTALAWIRAVTYDPQAEWNTISASTHICAPKRKKKGCELPGACFQKPSRYPESRKQMKRTLGSKYQPLLWDIIWNHDLDQYRLIKVDSKKLEQMKKVSTAQVLAPPTTVTAPDGSQSVRLQVKLAGAGDIKGASRTAEVQTILWGTPRAGLRTKAKIGPRKGNVLELNFDDAPLTRLPMRVLITAVTSDIMLFGESPTHLVKRIQQDAYTFSTRGTSDQQKAQQSCNIQMVEGIFGAPRLKRDKK